MKAAAIECGKAVLAFCAIAILSGFVMVAAAFEVLPRHEGHDIPLKRRRPRHD